MTGVDAVVSAAAGTIRGFASGGVNRFLGIPYAAAPVGRLRFAEPKPQPPFRTPFDALTHGATPQRVPLFATTTIPEPSIPGDATLTLDVFAPARATGAPVLFWIHGGGYIAGSPASPWYRGCRFAREGVIVVNASYRLGVDGFGVLPGRPANRGLRDLMAALQWVLRNIEAFGGDPGRVTIAGQSAGGGAVLALLASPAAAGLFHRAISISGVDVSLDAGLAMAGTQAIAARMGIEATADGFGPRDDGSAMRAILAMRAEDAEAPPLVLGPIHGDDVLPDPVRHALRVRGRHIPLLLGSTADEFDGGPTPEDPNRPGPDDPSVLAAKAAGSRVTDTLFRAACVRTARSRADPADAAAEAPAGTWLYSFEWPSPVTRGATHCIDVPFFLGNLDREGVPETLGPEPPAALGAAAHGDVLGFVRGGRPGWDPARGERGDPARVYGASGLAGVSLGAYDACIRHVD